MSLRYHALDDQLAARGLRGKAGVKGLKKILKEQVRYLRRANWMQRRGNTEFKFNEKRVGLLSAISPRQTKPMTKKRLTYRITKTT